MGMIEGAIEREGLTDTSSSGSGGLAAFGDGLDDQGGEGDSVVVGEFTELRRDSPMPRETGLIVEMEREAMEAGAGGWFNGNSEDVLESWSGANSDASASQD